jgi:hypothetical protein
VGCDGPLTPSPLAVCQRLEVRVTRDVVLDKTPEKLEMLGMGPCYCFYSWQSGSGDAFRHVLWSVPPEKQNFSSIADRKLTQYLISSEYVAQCRCNERCLLACMWIFPSLLYPYDVAEPKIDLSMF